MKITAGTLLLAVAVFLDSIELISSVEPVQTTLAQLFPEYEQNGYLPPVQIFGNRETTRSTAFTQIDNDILRRPEHDPPFLARGHVIFAWRGDTRSDVNNLMADYIEPLWHLFQGLQHPKHWVFDTSRNHWATLNRNEFDKLGFGYMFTLVLVQQYTAAVHRLATDNPVVYARAHHTAYLRANEAINMLQVTEAEKIYSRQTSVGESAILITRRYVEAYNVVFREIVRESG